MTITGGCLCGNIRYEIEGEPAAALNCHCSICRKAHGTPYGAFAVVSKKQFKWTQGEAGLASYSSSAGFERHFCPNCGSQLVVLEDWNPAGVTVAMGTIDDDPGIRVQGHMFVDSKACWHEITDDLPQSGGWPEGVGPQSQPQ